MYIFNISHLQFKEINMQHIHQIMMWNTFLILMSPMSGGRSIKDKCLCFFLWRTNKKELSHGTQTGPTLNKQTSVVKEYHLRDRHVYLPSTRWPTGCIAALHEQHLSKGITGVRLQQTSDCTLITLSSYKMFPFTRNWILREKSRIVILRKYVKYYNRL